MQPSLRRELDGGDYLYCGGSWKRHVLSPVLEEAAQLRANANSSCGDAELFLSIITKITKATYAFSLGAAAPLIH